MEWKRIRRGAVSLAIACAALFCFGSGQTAAAQEVVGYYAAWASSQGYSPEKLSLEGFTQINYAFAAIDGKTGQVVLEDPARDEANLAALTARKKMYPALKIVLSIGGWDDSVYFSAVAGSKQKREAFARSCAETAARYHLDGVDIDWEYPVSGGAPGSAGQPADRENFTLLLRAVRKALDEQGRQDGKDYRLTIAGGIGAGYLLNIQAREVAETVDLIFLMSYDIHGSWDRYTDLHAPLYTPDGPSPQYRYSVDSGVSAWLDQGVPAAQLVLGIPLYGYIYEGVSPGADGLHRPFRTARSMGYDAIKGTYLADSAYIRFWQDQARTPYLYGKQVFVTYEDETSVTAKGEFARLRALGGIGFWELSQNRTGELVQSACGAFGASGPFRDVPSDAWYAEAAVQLYEAGVLNGTAPGVFSPRTPVTRGMAVTLLHRLAGAPEAGAAPFSDVAGDAYCAQAVAWAAEKGIAEGIGDGTFQPDAPVQRQQLAAFLWRYAVLEVADRGVREQMDAFADRDRVAAYAADAVSWAVAEGLLQGTDGGMLLPDAGACRDEAAVLLMRFLYLMGNG